MSWFIVRAEKNRRASRCIGRAVEALELRRLFSVFIVTTPADSGAGSLRQAILDANANAGADTIDFNIPGGGVHTISPSSVLPNITDAVTIDGYSQPGASPNTLAAGDTAVLNVVLDGSNINLFMSDGLVMAGGNSVVQGLIFNGWVENSYNTPAAAVVLASANNTVSGNFFGTDATGVIGVHETISIIDQGANNLIGGTTPADRNLIDSSPDPNFAHVSGVDVFAGTSATRIVGNYIGADATGTHVLGEMSGISVSGGANATIGGTQNGAANVILGNTFGIQMSGSTGTAILNNQISGNSFSGIYISAVVPNTAIQGNLIGTDPTGMFAIPNGNGPGSGGIVNIVQSAQPIGTLIGGTNAAQRNIISGNHGDGIASQFSGITVQGNYIGIDITGNAALPNTAVGVIDDGGLVGGTSPGQGNVISGNRAEGVLVELNQTTIQGNLIGTNLSCTAAIPNHVGISVFVGPSNSFPENVFATIGGTIAAARNIISGNIADGIDLGLSSVSSVVQGNYIGVDSTGAHALGNGGDGIHSSATAPLIGGAVGAGNVISGNGSNGIVIDQTASVQGNFIGTSAAGDQAIANHAGGIKVLGTATTIGGMAPNVISGNDNANDPSFYAGSGIVILSGNSTVTVKGNFIGTNAAGTGALGNFLSGIFIAASNNNIIGGPNVSDGNVISGNGTGGIPASIFGGGDGLTIEGVNTIVQNNYIGTDSAGVIDLGNAASGIAIYENRNNIGGEGGQNTIAFNGRAGVAVGSGVRNAILNNSIYSNSGLGIDLGGNNTPDGVTSNHNGPASGPNHFQNYPVLSSAISGNGVTTINGTLNSLADGNYTLQLFIAAPDPSGFGEGKFYLGSAAVVTDSNGNASFSVSVPTPAAGQSITATATNSLGNTSEFAANIVATGSGGFAVLSGSTLNVYGTAGNDTINITTGGGNVNVNVDGQSSSFSAGSVSTIVVNAGDGADVVNEDSTAPASIYGGPGNDTLSVVSGNDLVVGGAGDDSIVGGNGQNMLWGGIGNDTLVGGAAATLFYGKAGDDLILAHNGFADTIYGGTGNDTAHVDQGLDLIPNNDVESIANS